MLIAAITLAWAQDPQAAELEAWIHDGLPAPPAAWELDTPDPARRLAFDLALLAPARTCGFEVPEAARAAAAARVLEAWLDGRPEAQRNAVPARLRGLLAPADARRLLRALRIAPAGGPSLDQIAALLKSQPAAIALDLIVEAALDEEIHPGVRGDLAEHAILALGRPAIERLRPALAPASDERFLRQAIAAWRNVVQAEDIPLLEAIAREGYGSPTQYALQLWARLERDPARRRALFELAVQAPSGYANLALDALASGGPDEQIAGRLRELLRAGTTNQRALALRSLAGFSSQAALLEAYLDIEKSTSLAAAAAWMPVLAQSPLPAARATAAEWLARGGFASGSTALVVVRALADSPEVVQLLGGLLANAEVPKTVRSSLALAHAGESLEALAYLRDIARYGEGVDQMQAVQFLGVAAQPEDLDWLGTLARGSEFNPAVRALAFEKLLQNQAADDLAAEWLAAPPAEWELAEGLVRSCIEHGTPAQRDAALDLVRAGAGFADSQERSALRSAAWQALANRGDPRDLPALTAAFTTALEGLAEEGRPAEENWRDLYERVHAWSELESIAAAAQTLGAGGAENAAAAGTRAWNPTLTAPEALWSAAALWSAVDPDQAVLWLDELEAQDLTEANRVRVLALRAARARFPFDARRSLRALLAEPALLREYPLLLAQAFAPEGAGWTLFHDQIAEREILADAHCQPPEEARERLARLLDGWTEAGVLLEAARDAATDAGDPALALRLARRGRELHPLDAELGLLFAGLLEQSGDLDGARAAWAAVERLVPPGFPQRDLAAARRQALEAAAGPQPRD